MLSRSIAIPVFTALSVVLIASHPPIQGSARPQSRQAPTESRGAADQEIARLTSQLNSSEEEQRREAVLQLSLLEDRAAMPALLAALNDRSERVRAAALTGLALLKDPSLVPVAVSHLGKDKSIFVKKSAAYALGRLQAHEGTVALVEALKHKDVEVRSAAAVALGEYADAYAVPPLVKATRDKTDFVRAQAARALGTNGRAAVEAVPVLIKLLTTDTAPEVKREAATSLGLIGDPSALPALTRAQRSADPHLSAAALSAITRIQNPGSRI